MASAAHHIVLVAEGGHEVHVSAHILAAASPTVWGERLAIAPPEPLAPATRSIESGISASEVDAFVGVLTLFTPSSTMPSLLLRDEAKRGTSLAKLDLERLTAALTLVHKYDCGGLRKLIAYLADWHFPKCTRFNSHPKEHHPQDNMQPIADWLTQAHLDFMMRAQELFSADESGELLNQTCIELLAHALSTPCGVQWTTCVRFANGYHFRHGSISIVDKATRAIVDGESDAKTDKSDPEGGEPNTVYRHSYDASSASLHIFCRPLVIEPSRLALPTMMRLLPYMQPRSRMYVASPSRKVNEVLPAYSRTVDFTSGPEDAGVSNSESD